MGVNFDSQTSPAIVHGDKKAKGVVTNGYLKFIKRKWGVSGMEFAMKYAGISTAPRDGDWVAIHKSDLLLEWIAKEKGESYVVEAGKYTAKDRGIFTYLVASVVGIETFLRKAQGRYAALFNFGSLDIDIEEKSARVIFRAVRRGEESCLSWKGALQGIMEVTRSSGTVEPISSDSDEDCAFALEWD